MKQYCKDCQFWVPRGQGNSNTSGWCVSPKIAKSYEGFAKDSIMCQTENIRTNLDDSFLITGSEYGCVHYDERDA
ncbi:MAG: hypothetical protein IEMM0008_0810 [bacterium]|nr:MAG: hypothetical protein IEMM0008_0810 [bacterium]